MPLARQVLLVPAQVLFASFENLMKQILDALLQSYVRVVRFRRFSGCIRLFFGGGSSSSSHEYRLFLLEINLYCDKLRVNPLPE